MSPELVEEINQLNLNRAKGLAKGIFSGKYLPTLSNIGDMVSSAYNYYISPETSALMGVPPAVSISPKTVIQSTTKAKDIASGISRIARQRYKSTASLIDGDMRHMGTVGRSSVKEAQIRSIKDNISKYPEIEKLYNRLLRKIESGVNKEAIQKNKKALRDLLKESFEKYGPRFKNGGIINKSGAVN